MKLILHYTLLFLALFIAVHCGTVGQDCSADATVCEASSNMECESGSNQCACLPNFTGSDGDATCISSAMQAPAATTSSPGGSSSPGGAALVVMPLASLLGSALLSLTLKNI